MTPSDASTPASAPTLDVSVVAPAHNEEGNIAELIGQVGAALEGSGHSFEFVIVDDASTDATVARATDEMAARPWVRVISLPTPAAGGGNGQSAAFKVGFARARGRLIAVLDADLQNDPADLPAMIAELERTGADFVQGDRSRARADNWARKQTSMIGRLFRRMILGDTIRDTGCSLRVMKREIALRLPLEFKGMHRFIPATARHLGYTVVEMPVNHRERHAGETKYGSMGITKRALPGLVDCFAVRYMRNRRRTPGAPVEVRHADALPAGTVTVERVVEQPVEADA
ncbi:MAG: glycosyl transferase [Phycisphaeraceae bacterium]|nr:MAG: glycosyl transferase [Phycisphaeraceae bacterium]